MKYPLFSPNLHAKRRRAFAQTLSPNKDLVILYNAPCATRNYDSEYSYRPDSNFLYLSGFEESGAVLVMHKSQAGKTQKLHSSLFCMEKEKALELWTGKRVGPTKAKTQFGMSQALAISKLNEYLKNLLKELPKGATLNIHTNAYDYPQTKLEFDQLLNELPYSFANGRFPLESIISASARSRALRLIKDKEELQIMAKSSAINVAAHKELLSQLRPGLKEYQMQAIIEAAFKQRGALSPAYGSILAAGDNACCLHYIPSDRTLKKNELLLVDAGCEYRNYASDITRTYPASGKYSKAQANIVSIVCEAYEEAVHVARPGRRYEEIHQASCKAIVEGLRSLKLLKGTQTQNLKSEKYREYFPHGTGHWMGIDVHDPCPYYDEKLKSLKLQPGMVFTVEPGLYFQSYHKEIPAEYRGIGVRVEDDILVTRSKPKNLTAGLPMKVDEVERFMARRKKKK